MTELFTLIKNKRKGYFWAVNILTILICYGFSLFNCTIGVDDENIVRSLEWRLFETGRFGLNVINLFFNLETFLPGFYMILCLLLMVFANHIVTCKLKLISENSFNEVSSSLFSVVLFSFPNFAYKFIFEQNLLQIGLVYLSSAIVFFFQYDLLYKGDKKPVYFITVILLMCFILFNFEAGIIISMLFVFYAMIISKDNDKKSILKKAGIVLIQALAAVLLFLLIRFWVLKISGVIIDDYANGYILYTKDNFINKLGLMFDNAYNDVKNHVFRYLMYTALVLGLLALSAHKKLKGVILFAVMLLLALSMILLTGNFFINKRVTLYVPVFFALCVSSCYIVVTGLNKMFLKVFLCILLIFMVYNNSLEVNKIMYGDYLRGKLDEIKAYDIYNDIKSITDSAEDKPTVFIGASESYKLPFDIKYGIESIFVHDISTNNYLARETINFRIYPYFRMLGLPLAEADDILYTKCLAKANDMPSYPKDGYIKENNEAIVVKLGDIEEIVPVKDISLVSGNIRAKMDTFNLSDNILNVSGWAILENAPVNRVKKKLLITKQGTGEKYIYNCGNVSRLDVVNKLGLYDDFEYCGYFGYINTEKFENGNYTVQLILDLYGQLYSTDIIENMEINIK